jgi:hypothetical protein
MQHVRDWKGATALSGRFPLNDKRHLLDIKELRKAGEIGERLYRNYLRDGFATYDQATIDSAGAFLVGELERLDPMIHEPLVSTTWPRDIDLRTDVQMGDNFSSFTVSQFGATGTPNTPLGISWASPNTTTMARPTLDIDKVINPLDLWASEVAYTVPELRSAEQLGRPIDSQQLTALNLKHQMDADQLVYIGDPNKGTTGLVNNASVSSVLVAPGASGSTLWSQKVPEEILSDFNSMLTSVWKASGYAVVPNQVRIAPVPFGNIATEVVSAAGNRTILNFITEENILKAEKGVNLDIKSLKWLDKNAINGPGGSVATYDSMMCYTREQRFVRWPMVPLVSMAAQFQGIWIKVPYYGRMGVVEVVYPETIGVRSGIN